MKQVLVVFHLREGSELEAEKLATSEPPFDPKEAGFARLAVYLTHREAIFSRKNGNARPAKFEPPPTQPTTTSGKAPASSICASASWPITV